MCQSLLHHHKQLVISNPSMCQSVLLTSLQISEAILFIWYEFVTLWFHHQNEADMTVQLQ